MHFQGKLYRAINPLYAREPLSGRGAALYGGRFNPRGMPALYTALSIMTVIREANQVGNLQPTTLVCYEADIARVFDTRDHAALAAEAADAAMLADPGWRNAMMRDGEAPSQSLARRLADQGWHGLLVRSQAPGAGQSDLNLVLWHWGPERPHRLTVIDEENRLR